MCYRTAHHPHWGRHHARHHAGGKQHGRHHGGHHWKSRFAAQWGYPPVNVEEHDDKYVIALYAAGYDKTDFQVKLEDNMLIISVDKPENESDHYFERRRFQFKPGSFQREFELNDKIDKDGISAKYEEGILNVTLPKLPGFETIRKDVGIA